MMKSRSRELGGGCLKEAMWLPGVVTQYSHSEQQQIIKNYVCVRKRMAVCVRMAEVGVQPMYRNNLGSRAIFSSTFLLTSFNF